MIDIHTCDLKLPGNYINQYEMWKHIHDTPTSAVVVIDFVI